MPKLIDLTGKQFGLLTVQRRADNNTSDNKPQWICNCACGNTNIIVAGGHLRNGHTKSCGCLQKQAARELNFKDISNQRFGKLIALSTQSSNKQGAALWHCKCDCGNEVIVRGMDLRNGHTTSCGCKNSKGEEKISQLLQNANISFEQQKTFNTCIFPQTGGLAKFDFFVDNQYLIEYDGIQHYECNGYGWNNPDNLKQTQYRDNIKTIWCQQNQIPLIRIPYIKLNDLVIEDLLLNTTKYRVV